MAAAIEHIPNQPLKEVDKEACVCESQNHQHHTKLSTSGQSTSPPSPYSAGRLGADGTAATWEHKGETEQSRRHISGPAKGAKPGTVNNMDSYSKQGDSPHRSVSQAQRNPTHFGARTVQDWKDSANNPKAETYRCARYQGRANHKAAHEMNASVSEMRLGQNSVRRCPWNLHRFRLPRLCCCGCHHHVESWRCPGQIPHCWSHLHVCYPVPACQLRTKADGSYMAGTGSLGALGQQRQKNWLLNAWPLCAQKSMEFGLQRWRRQRSSPRPNKTRLEHPATVTVRWSFQKPSGHPSVSTSRPRPLQSRKPLEWMHCVAGHM